MSFVPHRKSTICWSCKESVVITCSCGCNETFSTIKWKQLSGLTYRKGHRMRGIHVPGKGFKIGAANPMADPKKVALQIKNSFKRKAYSLGNQIVYVQGYEPFALDILLKDKSAECITVTSMGCMPRIAYTWKGKNHYHYPDIYIEDDGVLIDVKSTLTIGLGNEEEFNRVNAKFLAACKHGFMYEIWLIYFHRSLPVKINLPFDHILYTYDDFKTDLEARIKCLQ